MEIVIGLIGAKGAGKTTAFNVIQDSADVQEITLAAKLKDVCAEVFDIPREAFDSHRLKEKELETLVFLNKPELLKIFCAFGEVPPDFDRYVRPHVGKVLVTPRQVAQYVGTEVLRNYKEDIHCEHAAKAITKRVGVVTDMRFPNEYEYFSKNYQRFYPIYIKNNGAENEAGKDTHASEAYLRELAKKAEITVANNAGIKDFQESIRKVIKGLL